MSQTSLPSRSRRAAALIGESIREMAILIAVFAPLDFLVEGKPLTSLSVGATLFLVAVLFVTGLLLEVHNS